ncbi:MAG: histidinol-phosphate transaminase [Crocinitomicaceae bacterium]|nr:histidinol-phosphate transaminase [Crocinitomicaceae bacterium]
MKTKKQEIIRLNANENIYGCSRSVLKAIKRNIKDIYLYPAMPVRLEEKLAEKFGVEPKNIVVGAGSVRLIDGIIQTFVEHDEEIIIFERSFVAYEQLSAAHRRKHVFAKLTDFICDVDNILPLVTKKTKVIFIANPNNPTGTIITHARLEHLLEVVSNDILIVVDEAYCEYVTDKSFPDSFSLQKKYPNLIILRTFSKIHGLAGLRIGYGVMKEELAGVLKKSRIPFFFNSLSEDAALAALADEKFILLCAKKNEREREFLYEKIKQAGLNIIPSQGNFLYIHFNNEEEKEKIFKRFAEKGLLICNLKTFGQDKSLRIGIGNRKINKELYSYLSIH